MLTIDDVRSIPLFSTLAVPELERLSHTSADLRLAAGEYAAHEGEDERALFEDLVLRTPPVVMSIVAVVESTISLYGKRREPDADRLDEVLTTLRIDVQPVDLNQGFLARQAFVQYGRRRHPAALNLGDCFTCACKGAQ